MSWYPLGRPVGTTIYPGLQFTAVWIHDYILKDWSINDVCVYIPTWGGVCATAFTGLIAYEASIPANSSGTILSFLMDFVRGEKSTTPLNVSSSFSQYSPAVECAVMAMCMMAIVPAHLMRSVGGGFDNESVAVSAMVSTFYFWMRSLRSNDKYASLWSIPTALAYFYMVAAWGGYVFVINMIGVHAAALVAMGRFDRKVWMSYTIFYVIGTTLATRVPVVGWTPLKSLEQMGPALVFVGYQLLMAVEIMRKKRALDRKNSWKLRIQVFASAFIVAVIVVFALTPRGYFGPISARVRGLFVKHTKTGNPLVDSVAEHQAASNKSFFQFLHHVCTVAPIGFFILFGKLSDSSSFLLVWGIAAYFFSIKMVRLILLAAPIGSALGGIAVGRALVWCVKEWWDDEQTLSEDEGSENVSKSSSKAKKKKVTKKVTPKAAENDLDALHLAVNNALTTEEGKMLKRLLAILLVVVSFFLGSNFVSYCWKIAPDLSNPSIIIKARLRDGRVIKADDYREAYWWLRENTTEDARVLAWWDYGYQIAGIANRTTIADGNTWNHEHIALLAKALTSDLEEGYEIIRHLADYVLLWTGGGGDDLAKSPHLARIANSVYRDHCPDDPTCRAFTMYNQGQTPSAMMERSLLYHLHSHKIRQGVIAPADKFFEVYRSRYGKVRIYRVIGSSAESKEWNADPANRICDVPGSWYCPGQYPPGLKHILEKKKDFRQLEDFNYKGEKDDEYMETYMRDLHDPETARKRAMEKEAIRLKEKMSEQQQTKADVSKIYSTWQDTEDTTRMWKLINDGDIEGLASWLDAEPHKAFIRSVDGRGPMWWAFEKKNEAVVKLLMGKGVPYSDKDAKGITPKDLLQGSQEL